MRGLFSRLGGASPKAQAAPVSAQQDIELPSMLSKTGELLKQLRDSSSEDFPLLNEATRHSEFGTQIYLQLLLLMQYNASTGFGESFCNNTPLLQCNSLRALWQHCLTAKARQSGDRKYLNIKGGNLKIAFQLINYCELAMLTGPFPLRNVGNSLSCRKT